MSQRSHRRWLVAGVGVSVAAVGVLAITWLLGGSTLSWSRCGQEGSISENLPGSDIPATHGVAFCSRLGEAPVVAISTNTQSPLDVDHVIFFHPGGPGFSYVEYLRSIGQPLTLESSVFIAIDGRSAGQQRGYCGTFDAERFLTRSASDPDPELDGATSVECLSGGYGQTSAEEARDWERLRVALKIDRIDIVAHSYGTLVAEMYARQYPERVGRMVADGVMGADVDGDVRKVVTQTAIRASVVELVARCKAELVCSSEVRAYVDVHPTYDDIRSDVLGRAPHIGSGAETLTESVLDAAALVALRDHSYHETFFLGIAEVIDENNAAVLFTLAERLATGVDRSAHFFSLCGSILPPDAPDSFALSGDPVSDAWLAEQRICSKLLDTSLSEVLYGSDTATSRSGGRADGAVAQTSSFAGVDITAFAAELDPLTPEGLLDASDAWVGVPRCVVGRYGHTAYGDEFAREQMVAFLDRSTDADQIAARCAAR